MTAFNHRLKFVIVYTLTHANMYMVPAPSETSFMQANSFSLHEYYCPSFLAREPQTCGTTIQLYTLGRCDSIDVISS